MMDNDIAQLGLLDDEDILLDEAALLLAGADHLGVDLDPYAALIDELVARLREVGGAEVVGLNRARLLSRVLADEFGFVGSRETYDGPDNGDLIRVIDRRQGLPVSLSILYVAIARRLGWTADALDVPGHVLTLIGDDRAKIIGLLERL